VATGSLELETRFVPPFTALWTGTLRVPATGRWGFTFYTHGGTVELRADGRTLFRSTGEGEHVSGFDQDMVTGNYALELEYRVSRAPGAIQWAWTPPGGAASIVPPSVLRPPTGSTVGSARDIRELGPVRFQRAQRPMELVP